jgi:hypothetical protein
MFVDFPDESQRQMQLLVILPTRARNPAHEPEKLGANGCRRAECNKQAVHNVVFRLKSLQTPPILCASGYVAGQRGVFSHGQLV